MSVDNSDRVFDAYRGEMGQQFMRETQRRIHWMCAAAQGDSLLDVGCSQGLVPILLGREGKQVMGIDSSPEAIRSAEQHLVDEPVGVRKRVTFLQADFTTHDFGVQRFDCLIMGEVLEHLVHPERFIEVAAGVLAPGGKLVVTVPFGINDHPDHKQTFYLSAPFRLLHARFDVVEWTLLGEWLGLVGVKREHPAALASTAWTDQQLRDVEMAFHSIERGLRDESTGIRARLEEANAKYRVSGEEIARLRREVAQRESEHQLAARAQSELEQKLTEAHAAGRSEPDDELRQQLQAVSSLLREREVDLARLEERLVHAKQLRELELGARDAELSRLQRGQTEDFAKLRALEAHALEAEQVRSREVARLQEQNGLLFERLEASQRRVDLESQRARDLEAQSVQHQQERETWRLSSADEQRRIVALQAELDVERESRRQSDALAAEQAAAQSRRLVEQEARMEKVQAELKERDTALVDARGRLEQSDAALAASRLEEQRTRARLSEARPAPPPVASDSASGEGERETLRQSVRDLERTTDRLRQQLFSATQAERLAIQKLEQERRGKVAAERQVVQTRNTISFQLGYQLIHGFKSKDRLRALPGALWAIKQEAERRRAERNRREQPMLNAERTPLAQPAAPDASPLLDVRPAPPRQAQTARAPTADGASTPEKTKGRVDHAPQLRQKPALDAGLSQLKVACIHDEFTFASYAPECALQQLSPASFLSELEAFQPDLLFVESAWRGRDDLWGKKVSHRAKELVDAVEWCQARGVPTVFWNKEDPVHFGTFLNTAKLFDFVFTTDLDCVERYQRALGHDRVYLLPFACQPALHNPIEKYTRKEGICFAGAYYARYPERQQDLASFAQSFTIAPRLEIFDRNYGKNDPNYAFPAEYQPHIVGTLSFDDIDRAYKGYRYALNLNSIKESQTMFARRVFELLASNTTTVSNFSRGVRLLFGDLVITTDSGPRALEQLREHEMNESRARRLRLAALRKVLTEHTYGERLRFLASCVWGKPVPSTVPSITVVALADTLVQARALLAAFERQSYPDKRLVLVTSREVELPEGSLTRNIQQVSRETARSVTLGDLAPERDYVASFCARDHYGESYLRDLALATSYSTATAFGKAAHYVNVGAPAPTLVGDGAQYRIAASLSCRAALIRRNAVAEENLSAWLENLDARGINGASCFATDEFNYCRDGADLSSDRLAAVDDLKDIDSGLSLSDLGRASVPHKESRIAPAVSRRIAAERLAAVLKSPQGKPFSVTLESGALLVQSSLPDETHEYLYSSQLWKPEELGFKSSNKFHLEATPGLNIGLALLFLDEKKQRLGHKVCPASRNESIALPEGTAFVQLGLRIYGNGSSKITGLLLDHVLETPPHIFGRSDYLVLTNHYPADGDLYRNAFVHRRVIDYRKQGARVDIFRFRTGEKLRYREFEGIDVVSGGAEALAALLRSNSYRAVLVHFLDEAMWHVLREHAKSARLLVWLHGAEVQAWHRRSFNYQSESERDAAKLKSARRDTFWRTVLRELPSGGKLIFVSRHFLEQTLGDLGLAPSHPHCTVIHNLVDGELFRFDPKPAAQRTRVLSIRPYVSRKYANDLAVAAILELSRKPYFDQLSFLLIGDGPLFDETVAPLRSFPNVQLEKSFLTQQQIAELHRSYGVFLCPTRDDTQGVSRDEAMASGLVPVTNRVSAVPEFVDESCCMLAAPESYLELAGGIARLFEDPALFTRMSERAAERVRRQSSNVHTTHRELALITGEELAPPVKAHHA